MDRRRVVNSNPFVSKKPPPMISLAGRPDLAGWDGVPGR
jgi:hypothetical protein